MFARPVIGLLAAVVWFSLSACTSTGGGLERSKSSTAMAGKDPATVLRARAQTLWDARQREDWLTTFTFEDQAYMNNATAEEYAKWASEKEPFKTVSFRLGDVAVDDRFGWVEVFASIGMRRFPSEQPRDVHRWDKWRLSDQNVWMPVPQQEVSFYPSSPVERDRAEESRLRERYDESWRMRTTGDHAGLYALCAPEDRKKIPFDQFVNAQKLMQYLDRKIEWIQVYGVRGTVRVEYTYKVLDPSLTKLPSRSDVINELWVKDDGQWYIQMTGPTKDE